MPGKITLRNDSGHPQKIAALQISSSLNWRSIRVDGKAVQFVSQPYVSDIDHTGALSEAIVTLPVEIKPKDSVELEIGYEGVIPLDTTRLTRVGVPEGIAKHSSWDQISPSFTAVRGAGYVAWYPITTESADFSEGNSLFEVVDRWKAREAGSEFKAKLVASGVTGEAPRFMICSPGGQGSIEAMGRAQQVFGGMLMDAAWGSDADIRVGQLSRSVQASFLSFQSAGPRGRSSDIFQRTRSGNEVCKRMVWQAERTHCNRRFCRSELCPV